MNSEGFFFTFFLGIFYMQNYFLWCIEMWTRNRCPFWHFWKYKYIQPWTSDYIRLPFYEEELPFSYRHVECKHAATPLSFYSINTTHQGFQKRYITLLYLKGLKSYQPSKFKCLHFTPLSLVNRTFHLHFCWYLLSPLRYKKVKYLFWKPWSVILML